MGYFTNGFVFISAPDFKAASAAVPGRFARGYKHKVNALWLLDLWRPRGRLQLRCAPFCDPAADGFSMNLDGVDAPTRAFLATFERMKRAVGYRDAAPEVNQVHLALAVAAAARCTAFFFAADDEDLDMGCRSEPESLVSFGCRLDRLSVQYTGGLLWATPLNDVEDDDDEGLQELIANVRRVSGIAILPTRDVEGGQVLYENPVAQWPHDAGDPATILGLGTWDPLSNLKTDFTIVFEHLA